MTIQTDAQLQTELDANESGVKVGRRVRVDTTHESIFINCGQQGQKFAGRDRWVDVDPTSSAATQGALILTALGT